MWWKQWKLFLFVGTVFAAYIGHAVFQWDGPVNRLQTESSVTAEIVALIRHHATLQITDPKTRVHDPFAGHFVQHPRLKLRNLLLTIFGISHHPQSPFAFVQARTLWIDEFVQDHGHEVEQFVVLGAGFDSRAYRLMQHFHKVKVFEVDAPTTQRRKLSVLDTLGVDSRHVNFVSVNFASENFMDKMKESGFDANLRTLFLMEGVTYYLPQEALDATLSEISHTCPGSYLLLDLFETGILDGTAGRAAQALADNVAQAGERLLFGLKPDEITPFFQARNLQVYNHYTPEAIHTTYLTYSDGSVPIRMHGLPVHFVALQVKVPQSMGHDRLENGNDQEIGQERKSGVELEMEKEDGEKRVIIDVPDLGLGDLLMDETFAQPNGEMNWL